MEVFALGFIVLFVGLIVGLGITYLKKRKKAVDKSNYKRIPVTASYNREVTKQDTSNDLVTNLLLVDMLLDDKEIVDDPEETQHEGEGGEFGGGGASGTWSKVEPTLNKNDSETQHNQIETLSNTYNDSTPKYEPSLSFGSSTSSSKVTFDDDRKYADVGSSYSSYTSSSSSSSDSSSSYDSGSSSSSSSWD